MRSAIINLSKTLNCIFCQPCCENVWEEKSNCHNQTENGSVSRQCSNSSQTGSLQAQTPCLHTLYALWHCHLAPPHFEKIRRAPSRLYRCRFILLDTDSHFVPFWSTNIFFEICKFCTLLQRSNLGYLARSWAGLIWAVFFLQIFTIFSSFFAPILIKISSNSPICLRIIILS